MLSPKSEHWLPIVGEWRAKRNCPQGKKIPVIPLQVEVCALTVGRQASQLRERPSGEAEAELRVRSGQGYRCWRLIRAEMRVSVARRRSGWGTNRELSVDTDGVVERAVRGES